MNARASARVVLPLLPEERRLTALLRARARRLRVMLEPLEATAVAFLPALFHANFPWPELKSDPPGVEGARASLRWTRLARAFDLPVPTGIQRGRRLVQALLVVPTAEVLEVHVVPAPELAPLELQRVVRRARAVEALLARRHIAAQLTVTNAAGHPFAPGPRARMLAFGALVAGRLPARFFTAAPVVADPFQARLWVTAPTQLARALALLTLEPWPAGDVAELLEVVDFARALGRPLWRFAEPGLLTAARATLRSRHPELAFAACALANSSATAWELARHFGGRGFLASSLPGASEVLRVCRALAVELSCAVRARGLGPQARALRALLPHQLLSGGVPRMLLGPLQAALRRGARGELPAVIESRAGKVLEVRLSAGGVLGRGLTSAHAWARALCLLGHALGVGSVPRSAPPVWKKLAPQLLHAPSLPTHWLEVSLEPGLELPADPLNRGPRRELGITTTLMVTLRPGGRPTGRLLTPRQSTPMVLSQSVKGATLAFVASSNLAQPLEARLKRVAARCRVVTPHRPLAVEAGGEVFLVQREGLRQRSGRSFARRPEYCAFDAEAPDFGVQVTHGRELRVSPQLVECLVWSDDGLAARVLSADSEGWVLREEVRLEDVERHLSEAQRILRPHPLTALSVRVAQSVSGKGLVSRQPLAPPVKLKVQGELPFGLQLELEGELFGAGSEWGWRAAALAALSRWPPGVRGTFEFLEIDATLGGVRVGGLWRLYLRSLVRRRLEAHIEALARTFRVRQRVPNK